MCLAFRSISVFFIAFQVSGKWKVLFYTTSVIVQAALLIKCPLFIMRQISPRVFLPLSCPDANVSSTGQQYLFTLTVYSTLFIGRWLEALILHIHIYKFFFGQLTIKISQFQKLVFEGIKKKAAITIVIFLFVVLPLLIISLSVPILGIILEIRHGRKNCEEYIYEHHTVYWLLDIVRYLHDVIVRILLLLATIAIGGIWSEELQTGEIPQAATEPETYDNYLMDRDTVNEDHKIRTKAYVKRGGNVERILEIFQTWFTIPWLLLFIGSSLDSDHILRSWKDGPSDDGYYDFSEVTFMVYNFNQLFLLAFAYLCSKKMNTHHRNYIHRSRSQQLEKFKTASRMAFASVNKIEKEDHFDFTPRIWGTSIKVPIDSPLYIVLLFVSIFFTVIEALI